MDDMKLGADAAAALRSTASAAATETTQHVTQLPGLGAWVTSLVPANVVNAAAGGAMLPLIVFTLLFALATRRIDAELRQSLISFFGAVASATTTIVDWIIAVAPVGIFALVVVATARAGVALAGAMAYYVLAISAALVLFALLMYPIATTIGRIPLGWFTRGVLPAQAVALSTSSSLASLPALVEGARALGLPTQVGGFVLPLSVSTFKVATPITWLIGTLFLAKLYGVALGTTALVTMAITAVALSFTIPGVPQGAQLLLAPLLVTYGIPPEGVALLIAADTIPDLFGTMTNVTGDMIVGTIAGRHGVAEVWSQVASSENA
jgi:Na+/H+-dicarboxylate symporter